MVLLTNANAQERLTRIYPTYKFEFKLASPGDTSTTLYCVIKVSDLSTFVKVYISYNDKTKQYYTQNLLREKSTEYFTENSLVYIKINEQLDEPFVIIEGEDLTGRKHMIYEQNAKGKTVNSKKDRENWKKSMSRIDSMDFVRHYDGVYVGKDGKPRFRNKQNEVYIIEKNYVHPEKK
jgi:hypothetical protein